MKITEEPVSSEGRKTSPKTESLPSCPDWPFLGQKRAKKPELMVCLSFIYPSFILHSTSNKIFRMVYGPKSQGKPASLWSFRSAQAGMKDK